MSKKLFFYLAAMMLILGTGSVNAKVDTYEFTSKSFSVKLNGVASKAWSASNGSKNVTDASYYDKTKGFQTTLSKLIITSPEEYTNVDSVVVIYSTNSSSVATLQFSVGGVKSGIVKVQKNQTSKKMVLALPDTANAGQIVLSMYRNGTAGSLYVKEVMVYANDSFSLNVTAAGYATMFVDKKLVVPTGVEVYAPKFNSSTNTLALGQAYGAGAIVPANTGYLVKAEAGDYTFAPSDEGAVETESDLTGTLADTTMTKDAVYVLAVEGGQVGFYLYKGGKIGANRAFLAKQSEMRSIKFGDGETTAIETPALCDEKRETIYNLAGQRVMNPVKDGIYIVNGRKVLK